MKSLGRGSGIHLSLFHNKADEGQFRGPGARKSGESINEREMLGDSQPMSAYLLLSALLGWCPWVLQEPLGKETLK